MADKKCPKAHTINKKDTKRLMLGATLVEMLCLMALVPCILVGIFFGSAIIGNWYGWLLGAFLGFLAFFIFGAIWNVLKELWCGSGLPKCRNGCCRGPGFSLKNKGDYDIQESGEEFYRVCKCGDRYQRRGRRFVLINEDGTETPYLIWRRFRGWFPDKV